jgi:hypothetical protein
MESAKTISVAAVAVLLWIGWANAQTSGSGGGATSGSSGTGGTTSPGVTRGAPSGSSSTSTRPATTNRSNSEVFPPSRLAPRGSIQDPRPNSTLPSEQNGPGTQESSSLGSRRVPSPATGGINDSKKTQKSSSDSIAECEQLWAPRTQMSKSDWAETCRRSENNLGTRQ